jgi:two-component system sensor histidine kinase/response regulator
MALVISCTNEPSGSDVAADGVFGAKRLNGGAARFAPVDDSDDHEFQRMVRLARVGVLIIIAAQFAYLAWDLSVWRTLPDKILACHAGNILADCIVLSLTFADSSWLARRWRVLAFLSCSAVFAGMAAMSVITGKSGSLFVACMLLIVASGSIIPWEPRWQAAFNIVPVIALAIGAPYARDGFNNFQWVEILTAIVFAQVTNLTLTSHREALRRRLAGLRSSEEQLRAEVAHRRRTADKLAESEAMLRTIFDATVDLVTIVKFSDGKLIDVNAAIEHYGLTREMALGATTLSMGLWPEAERRAEFQRQINRDGIVRNFQFDMIHPNGTPITILMSSAVAQINGEKCIVSIARDISKIKANERELIAAREAALAASQAKSEFLSGMSHEIRTPMNAILGMAELLDETPLDDQQRNYLGVMKANGDSLMALINDILDLSKVESGRLSLEATAFDLERITSEVGATLGVSAHAKGLELVTHIARGVPRNLVGDSLRLKQILINLIGNAIKFTEHGEVVVRVESERDAGQPGCLRFAVTDTGIGIPADQIENLFSSFTQADPSIARRFGGSGLGLSIVRRLVELMGGRTWIESRLGLGSTFYFTAKFGVGAGVPFASEVSATGGAAADAKLTGLRALVVDDNRVNRMVVREIIAARGVQVAEAASGAQALGDLKTARHAGLPFDLVILDCRMPVMDGFEMVQQLRRGVEHNDTVVLMLTSDDLRIQLPRVRELGLDAYIVKPVRRADLIAAISIALAGRGRNGPASPLADPIGVEHGDTPGTRARRPVRVLLVDDSADNRLLINNYLKREPHRIDEAEDGEEGFRKATAERYDLILMDFHMPQVDGLEATQMIRDWETANGLARTPIIVLTASALEEDARRALAAGADAHVSKPITRAMLLEARRRFIPASDDSDLTYLDAPPIKGGRFNAS